jgi:Domain of unknown function (DUF4277)
MSATPNEIQVQNIDHLGIVAGIVDEIGLVAQVNELLGTHPQEVVSLACIIHEGKQKRTNELERRMQMRTLRK